MISRSVQYTALSGYDTEEYRWRIERTEDDEIRVLILDSCASDWRPANLGDFIGIKDASVIAELFRLAVHA